MKQCAKLIQIWSKMVKSDTYTRNNIEKKILGKLCGIFSIKIILHFGCTNIILANCMSKDTHLSAQTLDCNPDCLYWCFLSKLGNFLPGRHTDTHSQSTHTHTCLQPRLCLYWCFLSKLRNCFLGRLQMLNTVFTHDISYI